MFEVLESQDRLTGRQWRIVLAAILGDMLEFFDYFLIGFVLALVVVPWHLTYQQSAIILLSSGVGAIAGAVLYGWIADRIGRRAVFIATIINFATPTGLLAFTPDGGWLYLSVMRVLVGLGVGGLYCVDLPLVQEFVPGRKRALVSGLVTVFIPMGLVLASLMAAYLTPYVGWRGLFALGTLPAVLALFVRKWVPESPRWLVQQGRVDEARSALAWALERPISDLPPLDPTHERKAHGRVASIGQLFRYPRSLVSSLAGNLGTQTGHYGLTLWAPTLLMMTMGVTAAQSAQLMLAVSISGFLGRICFSFASAHYGRKLSAITACLAAMSGLLVAALLRDVSLVAVPVFFLMLVATYFFADGGFAVIGPYSAEVWPAHLRTTGMGLSYGFGGLGKIIGPLGLAVIVGSSNIVTPKASASAIAPAFIYLAAWFLFAAIVYGAFGINVKGQSLEDLEGELAVGDVALKRSGAA
jgi:MFS transporter, putative metabolite:H+ symporter